MSVNQLDTKRGFRYTKHMNPVKRFKTLVERAERIHEINEFWLRQWVNRGNTAGNILTQLERIRLIRVKQLKVLTRFCSKHFENPDLGMYFKLSDFTISNKPFVSMSIPVEYGNYLLGGDDLKFQDWILYTRNPR